MKGEATLGAGFGKGDTSSIAEFREPAKGGATQGADFSDANTSTIVISATRKGRGDKDMMAFRSEVR